MPFSYSLGTNVFRALCRGLGGDALCFSWAVPEMSQVMNSGSLVFSFVFS